MRAVTYKRRPPTGGPMFARAPRLDLARAAGLDVTRAAGSDVARVMEPVDADEAGRTAPV